MQLSLDRSRLLSRYWQQRPGRFPGAVVGTLGGIDGDLLTRLAGDPDIDREHVLAHCRVPLDLNEMLRTVDPGSPARHKPRAGMLCQLYQINIKLIACIVSRNEPRKHPGVSRAWIGVDNRHTRPRQRVHGPAS